jgi:hypothetical protein
MAPPRATLFLFRLLVIALAIFTGFRVTFNKIFFGIAPDEFALFLASILAVIRVGLRIVASFRGFFRRFAMLVRFLFASAREVAFIRFGFRIKALFGRLCGQFATLVLLFLASAREVAVVRFGFRINAFLGRFLGQFATLVLLFLVFGAITVRFRVRIEASFLGLKIVSIPRLEIPVAIPRVIGLARLLNNERCELVSL